MFFSFDAVVEGEVNWPTTLIEWRGQHNNFFIGFKYVLCAILRKRKRILQYLMK